MSIQQIRTVFHFFFLQKIRWHFSQIVSLRDSLHEISSLIFNGNLLQCHQLHFNSSGLKVKNDFLVTLVRWFMSRAVDFMWGLLWEPAFICEHDVEKYPTHPQFDKSLKYPGGRVVSTSGFGSHGLGLELCWRQNSASLLWAYYYHPSIISIWLKWN